MRQQLFGYLCALFVSFCNAGGELLLNPQATLLKEVKSIHHDELSCQVEIDLAEKRTCAQPTFMIRLSGTSLYMLDPVDSNQSHPDRVVFSYPPMKDSGTYFLEVLTMYCEAVDPNHISNMCLVHPQDGKNVLSLPYSFQITTAEPVVHDRPRWVLSPNASPALLPTRYQKAGPVLASDIFQHNLYNWVDKPPYQHLVKKALQWGRPEGALEPVEHAPITICMVGASHAYNLAEHGNALHIQNLHFVIISSRYPQHFDVRMLENCTYGVLGYGQWPLSSWMNGEAYTGPKYELEMRRVLEVIRAANLKTQVFTRSMNMHALRSTLLGCPSIELRHPPLVMMYNNVMSNVSAEFNIPFIDMHHIQAPLWDIALDWSHPKGRVFTAEAEYIVHVLLSYSHKHNRALLLDPSFAARVTPVYSPHFIRFNDSSTIYMEQVGELRPIPIGKTLYRVSYQENLTKVLDPKLRVNFKFGPILSEV